MYRTSALAGLRATLCIVIEGLLLNVLRDTRVLGIIARVVRAVMLHSN